MTFAAIRLRLTGMDSPKTARVKRRLIGVAQLRAVFLTLTAKAVSGPQHIGKSVDF